MMHNKSIILRVVIVVIFSCPFLFSLIKPIGVSHLTNLNLNAQPITIDGYAELATSEAAFSSAVTWSGVSGGILTYPSDVTLNGTWLFLGTTILTLHATLNLNQGFIKLNTNSYLGYPSSVQGNMYFVANGTPVYEMLS